jgi:cytochrome c-type biogenesis protein CcmH
MISFWILAAGLTTLALLFVVPPLLSRQTVATGLDQDRLNVILFREQLAELDRDLAAGNLEQAQYDAARRDLERELLADVDGTAPDQGIRTGGRWVAVVAALTIPLGAVGLYLQLGEVEMIPRLQATATSHRADGSAHAAGTAGDRQSMEALVQKLAARMEEKPEDLEGWLMLGRSYHTLERPQLALEAFEQAYALAPTSPEVLLALAQGLAAVNEGSLTGRPAELIAEALAVAPDNAGALWLNGMLAFQEGRYGDASRNWNQVLAQLEPDSDDAVELRQFIAEADRRSDEEPESSPASRQSSAETSPAVSEGVNVAVRLDESLHYLAGADDSLFVYAKAAGGSPVPLAVKRVQVRDLPLAITLDDSLAMNPAQPISSASEVIVGARISKSGEATPRSGDLEGESGPIPVGSAETVTIVIDQKRP